MVGICCQSAGLWSCVPVPDYFTGCCQEPAHNGHYVFNLLRVIKFVWICLNELVFLDNLLDWLIDSVTRCVRNSILPAYIPLHLISMFNTVCMCVVWMLSGHTTVHLSCWHWSLTDETCMKSHWEIPTNSQTNSQTHCSKFEYWTNFPIYCLNFWI